MTPFLAAALVSLATAWLAQAAVVSQGDARYGIWPRLGTETNVRIPVYIETATYTTDTFCSDNIKAALSALNRDLTGCIQFELRATPPVNEADFMWISSKLGTGTAVTCETVPGRMVNQNKAGQRVVIGGAVMGAASCCGTVKDAMRVIINTVGLRNEYLRPDRQLTASNNNVVGSLQTFNLFNAYTAANNVAVYNTNTKVFDQPAQAAGTILLDYNSVTMVSQTKYSAFGLPTWSFNAGVVQPAAGVGTLAALSATDCAALHLKYTCPAACPANLPL